MKTIDSATSSARLLLAGAAIFSGTGGTLLAVGPGFSGIAATADSAETVSSNPAGMARLTKPSLYGNPMVIFTTSETEFSSEVAGTGSVKNDAVVMVPGAYYVHPVNDKWAWGVGPNGASGIGTSYGSDWAGRYLLDEWSLVFAGVGASASYRVNGNLSLGLSVPLTYSKFSLSKAVYNGPGQADGKMELEADGIGVGIAFGILYEFSPATRIGLSYSSAVSVEEEGQPEFSGLTPSRESALAAAGILDTMVSMESTRPQYAMIGLYHAFDDRWSVTADAVWVDFSEMGMQDVVIGDTELAPVESPYKDIYGLTVGGAYQWSETWSLRAGAGYISSAMDEEDRTVFNRMGEVWVVGFGAGYLSAKGRLYSIDLNYLQFSDGKFAVADTPVLGDFSGEYTTNYGIAVSFAMSR
jgi:long-chain fatty acid transport protein